MSSSSADNREPTRRRKSTRVHRSPRTVTLQKVGSADRIVSKSL